MDMLRRLINYRIIIIIIINEGSNYPHQQYIARYQQRHKTKK